jgi:hypothetical protein
MIESDVVKMQEFSEGESFLRYSHTIFFFPSWRLVTLYVYIKYALLPIQLLLLPPYPT